MIWSIAHIEWAKAPKIKMPYFVFYGVTWRNKIFQHLNKYVPVFPICHFAETEITRGSNPVVLNVRYLIDMIDFFMVTIYIGTKKKRPFYKVLSVL